MTLDRIVTLCEKLRFQGNNERDLQNALETVLSSSFSQVQREVSLGARDRVDLLVERIGIEVKIDGSPMVVARQLRRYVESAELDALVLVTTRAKHRALPRTLGGKPLLVVWLHPF